MTHCILYVEQNDQAADRLLRDLAHEGIEWLRVTHPAAVVAVADRVAMAVIAIDDADQFDNEATQALRATRTAFAILTADTRPHTTERAVRAGASTCLQRPLQPDTTLPCLLLLAERAAEDRRLRASEAALKEAVKKSRLVGTAVGILAERLGLAPKDAFERLRSESRSARRSIAQSATAVCASAELAHSLPSHDGAGARTATVPN